MRLLIHYVGDIHQPLHASTRVDKENPSGDRGGNEWHLPSKDGAKNLHAVWDSVAYEFADDFDLPMSESSWSSLGKSADKLVKKHPVCSLNNVNDLDPHNWALESFEATSKFVYADIKEGDVLPLDYVEQAQIVCEK